MIGHHLGEGFALEPMAVLIAEGLEFRAQHAVGVHVVEPAIARYMIAEGHLAYGAGQLHDSPRGGVEGVDVGRDAVQVEFVEAELERAVVGDGGGYAASVLLAADVEVDAARAVSPTEVLQGYEADGAVVRRVDDQVNGRWGRVAGAAAQHGHNLFANPFG